jgi:hypothetical protein
VRQCVNVGGRAPIDKPPEAKASLEARCAAATPEQMVGTFDWAVLHFRRGGARAELAPLEACKVVEIGFETRSAA